jgi:hypothetical protein
MTNALTQRAYQTGHLARCDSLTDERRKSALGRIHGELLKVAGTNVRFGVNSADGGGPVLAKAAIPNIGCVRSGTSYEIEMISSF